MFTIEGVVLAMSICDLDVEHVGATMNAPSLKDPMDQRMAEVIDGDSRGSERFHILGICEEAGLIDHEEEIWNTVTSGRFHSFRLKMM